MNLEKTYQGYQENPRKRRSWAADNPGNVAIRAELLTGVLNLTDKRLSSAGKVLDVGCGGGWMLGELVQRGVEPQRLHGVDLIETRVNVAQQRLPGVDIRKADARHLPYADAQFELVLLLTCLSSIPSLDSIRMALSEAKRVLAPSGLLLCYEPRIPNPFNRATAHVPSKLLVAALGHRTASLRLTGFPPLARRLGPLTTCIYPGLSSLASTHRLGAYEPGTAPTRHE